MSFTHEINTLSSKQKPFFFIISYDMTKYEIIPLNKLPNNIQYTSNQDKHQTQISNKIAFEAIEFKVYEKQFQKIQNQIKEGNTYLLNLTSQTKLKSTLSLQELYKQSNSPNKLLYKDKFVAFSPEKFININNNTISTYPMKGTINADIKNAKSLLLNDPKELAEHTMIVDLLRNDLSMVATNIKVPKFRYIEQLNTSNKTLLQTSSKIQGKLKNNWQNNLGEIINTLLPAGSITGTPKKNTINLIKEIENYKRNFFTGIYGIFDGVNLKSYVLIRFIEKDINNNLVFKSGGGITSSSNVKKEYQELCDKIYI